jgi:hypothetical protein
MRIANAHRAMEKPTMADKPSYLGMLNAIAVGEARGQALFEAWADATGDAELATLLRFVAIREGEHAAAFTRRLCELGYSVQPRPDTGFEERVALLRSDTGDREKFETAFGYPKAQSDPVLATLFNDTSIDIETGALLGRFIAQERDTTRRLNAAYARVCANAATPTLEEITQRLARLTRTVEQLKAARRAGG